ncbi:histone deacetylase family protein [Denitrobaculum tricleocarpae]|uniref:Histone deacetylase family protein n=2 Tax=Denitrobaculum tricleocarpae TaxID=2591009 RepID=A0A545TQ77_9PROT|nr:histone deacetylase family protein [Denitrobaculum tricleocarpae]TQV79379.1 histone deacetylase family protein [Denitrobaculum tricleocarpae]
MKFVFDPAQSAHNPGNFLSSGVRKPNPETPARADMLLEAGRASGFEIEAPDDYGLAPAAAIHSPEYLRFLQSIHARWREIPGASDEVIPNVHPNGRPHGTSAGYPASAVGQAGYHMADTACPISESTWTSVKASMNTAVHATRQVRAGARAAYALCRPPGHHAFADMAGGFCYLNNSAIAAQDLRRNHDRVVVLDVDLHHGNGTQGIFYRRDDVLTISIHADPQNFYPFFWGHGNERGEDTGVGYNLNFPLTLGSGDKPFLAALDSACEAIAAFAPGAMVVALGLDAHESDPFAGLAVTTAGFGEIGREIGGLALPSVIVQEGGYANPALGANLVSFLEGFGRSSP